MRSFFYHFYNVSEKNLTFDDVYERILSFMREEPHKSYRLAIGTDSQVHGNKTRFITAIHVHRIGSCSWGAMKNVEVPRDIQSLREKIATEISLSQEIASLFDQQKLDEMTEILLSADSNNDFYYEIHIDIGKKGKTRHLINEMTKWFRGLGVEAKIKPESYAASCYANKYTK